MRFLFILILAAGLLTGCTVAPPKEAAPVRSNGDKGVMSLRMIADRNIRKRYDWLAAKAWSDWRTAYDEIAKEGGGKVSADFAEQSIEARDEHLARIEASRLLEMNQAKAAHAAYVSSSGQMYETWEESGQLSADMMNEGRAFAVEMAGMVGEYRREQSLAKEAKHAVEAAKSEEVK